MTTAPSRPAAGSAGGGRTQDPAAVPVAAAPADASPRGAAGLPSPAADSRSRAGEGTKTLDPAGSPIPLPGRASTSPRRERAARGLPGPETGARPPLLGQAPVRARPETPAGASGHDSPPAGSRGLRGAEWQAAVKKAQRRQPGRAVPRAAAKVTAPPPVTGGAALTAVANCLGRCGWSAGPGDPAEVDKLAERHTTRPPKHPTNVVSEPAA